LTVSFAVTLATGVAAMPAGALPASGCGTMLAPTVTVAFVVAQFGVGRLLSHSA
jgi:uncharacterized protein (DUF2062 family)